MYIFIIYFFLKPFLLLCSAYFYEQEALFAAYSPISLWKVACGMFTYELASVAFLSIWTQQTEIIQNHLFFKEVFFSKTTKNYFDFTQNFIKSTYYYLLINYY